MGHDLFDQRRLVGALDGRTLVRKSFELRRLHLASLLGVMARRGAIVMVAVAMMAHSQARVAYSTTGPTVELEGVVCLGLVVS